MAASDFHFYGKMFDELSTALSTYVGDTATSVMNAIAPVATTLVTIYVILWGWAMIRGVISEPIMDGFNRIVRMTIIITLAIQLGYYTMFISDFLWNTPDAMASVIGGSSGVSSANYLDQLMSQIYDMGDAYYQKSYANSSFGIPSIGLLMMAYAIWGAGVLATGYGAFLLALAKIALAVLLGVGPIFVLLTLFEPTKRFFDTWLGQALNYVLLVILSAAALKLIMSVLEHYLNAVGATAMADPSLNQAIPAVVFALIGFLVLMQIPSMASALGGGIAISTLGAVGWAYQRATRAAGGTRDLVTGKTLSDMRQMRRMKQKNAKWAANNPSMAYKLATAPAAVYRKVTGSSSNRVAKG